MIFLFLFNILAHAGWDYFPEDYVSARQEFRSLSQTSSQLKIPSHTDPDLTIDYAYFPGKKKENLVLLSSGVHGVEAFAGSAIQFLFLKEILPQLSRKNVSFLLIHSINPYGYKYLRRVSENNVDLNRNFDTNKKLFSFKNPGYTAVNTLLNPQRKVSVSSLAYYFSFVEMIWQIIQKSMKPLRQAILQGQYEHPKGLYFGGKNFEPQVQLLTPVLKKIFDGYRKILAIDLHTGYGEKNKLHLFGPTGLNPRELQNLQSVFKGQKVDTGSDEDFYETFGDFTVYTGKLVSPSTTYIPMTFEFGTLDSQTSTGALKSISNMILENQGHHYGYKSDRDRARVQERIQEMYYPKNRKWRNAVIEQARRTLPQAIKNLRELQPLD